MDRRRRLLPRTHQRKIRGAPPTKRCEGKTPALLPKGPKTSRHSPQRSRATGPKVAKSAVPNSRASQIRPHRHRGSENTAPTHLEPLRPTRDQNNRGRLDVWYRETCARGENRTCSPCKNIDAPLPDLHPLFRQLSYNHGQAQRPVLLLTRWPTRRTSWNGFQSPSKLCELSSNSSEQPQSLRPWSKAPQPQPQLDVRATSYTSSRKTGVTRTTPEYTPAPGCSRSGRLITVDPIVPGAG